MRGTGRTHGRTRGRVAVLPALAAALALTACGSDRAEPTATAPAARAPAPAAAQPAAGAREAALEIFATRCTTCHGPEGAGDGPGSANLSPPPRNFQDRVWQQSVSDEHIEQIIQYGGAAVGRSPTMPSNPDLMSKPEVVAALRQHIRSLASR